MKTWKAIWWAPRLSSPTRASTAPAITKASSSEPVRTTMWPPMRARPLSCAAFGRRVRAGALSKYMANAAPMPAWATTVPAALPSRPQSNPYTNTSSSTMLMMLATTTTISGERRSPMPRR